MYIQLTTACNMTCEHCCMSAESTGPYISRETFIAACKLAENRGDFITLGGGEPTLHPLFWDFLGIAQAYSSESPPLVITNGKKSQTAKRLAALAQRGAVSAELSLDQWHDPIEPDVVKAFTPHRSLFGERYNDFRGLRTVHTILNVGRASETGVWTDEGCCCEDLMVDPEGRLWGCGCKKVQFGTVFEPDIPESYCGEHVEDSGATLPDDEMERAEA